MVISDLFVAKKLNSLQLQAAELIARGVGESEVANVCGKSRSWVQGLKRREDFQQAVESSKQRVTEVIVEETKKAIINDLEQFRNRFNDAATLLYDVAIKYLNKVNQRVDELKIEEISPSRLSQCLKSGADTLVIALEINKAALGLDELMKEVDDIQKLNQTSINTTNGYKSIGAGFEAN